MKKYIVWIIAFAILLTVIPILIEYNKVPFAKVLGFVLVILITVAIRVWMRMAKKAIDSDPKAILNTNDIFDLKSLIPNYSSWKKSDQKKFNEQLASNILKFDFDNFDHSDPTKRNCLGFSALLTAIQYDLKKVKTRIIVVFKEEGLISLEGNNSNKYIFVSPSFIENQCKLIELPTESHTIDTSLRTTLNGFFN